MQRQLFWSPGNFKAVSRLRICPPNLRPFFVYFSSIRTQPNQKEKQRKSQNSKPNSAVASATVTDHDAGSPMVSTSRVTKLIASQSDPLLAKEIFDVASLQPNIFHSQSSYILLIRKLGRTGFFTLIDDVISRLKSDRCPATGTLFIHLIKIFAAAGLPEKVLKTFYTIMEFNLTPTPNHLNRILEALVAHRNYLHPAFDLFKRAHRYGVSPNTRSYNIMMRAFCLDGRLSVAYTLFNKMPQRDILPDGETYRILMQALCRKGQVNGAVDLFEDMLNKGFVPDSLCYTTLLNSMCRKNKLREAYKLLCRMKVKGCNPDIVHYNTMIIGLCRQGRSMDACKLLEAMTTNMCLPNMVSYRTLVNGLSDQGLFDEGKKYLEEMQSKGFSPHFSVINKLVKGFCNVGKIEEACVVLERVMAHGEAPHVESWVTVVPLVCQGGVEATRLRESLAEIMKVEIGGHTRIVKAGSGLGEYLIRKIKSKPQR